MGPDDRVRAQLVTLIDISMDPSKLIVPTQLNSWNYRYVRKAITNDGDGKPISEQINTRNGEN